MDFRKRLEQSIPGGAHTYSRGSDQFPSNAPEILKSGNGVYVTDAHDKHYLDFGMALRSVNIGYAEKEIDDAVIKAIRLGNNLTRPSFIELEAAEKMIDIVRSFEMVKFTKNGSAAVSAAVKLARAYTGKDVVLICANHPFFSFDDWFISSTPVARGIPKQTSDLIAKFEYNDINSLQEAISKFGGQIACVVMEPATHICPSNSELSVDCDCTSNLSCSSRMSEGNFLQQVSEICKKQNIVFILDEMITGFRWDFRGAQETYKVIPDLSTFGKAMANGYSVACVGGKREIMQIGGIENPGEERVFLLSTTHGAEMSGLSAFLSTVSFLEHNAVIDHLWDFGKKFIDRFNAISRSAGVIDYVFASGIPCSPLLNFQDSKLSPSLEFRTLFSQEMINEGVLMPWVSLAYRHGEKELDLATQAISKALEVYSLALESSVNKFLVGPSIKPVFRKFN